MSRLEEYQRQVMAGMLVAPGVDTLAHAALGLAGEAGEVADLVKKSQYAEPWTRPIDPARMLEELGDNLWYLTFLAGKHGWTLGQLAAYNIAKLEERHPGVYSYDRFAGAGPNVPFFRDPLPERTPV